MVLFRFRLGNLELKEGECYEMDHGDDEWGSFHVPSSHKLTWLKQADGLGSGWSQGPFWPLTCKHLHVVVQEMEVCPVFVCSVSAWRGSLTQMIKVKFWRYWMTFVCLLKA